MIRRVSDNAVIHNLDPSYGVVAFNRDDTQALIYTSPMASGVPTQLALVDVRTGAILWRSDGRQELSATLVQPDGGGFAILLRGPSPEILHQAVSMVIVKPDGSEIDVPGRYLQP